MSSLCRGLLRVRHPDNQIYSRDSQYGYKHENELAFGYHACFYSFFYPPQPVPKGLCSISRIRTIETKYGPSSGPLIFIFNFYTKTIGYHLRDIFIFKKKYIVCISITKWI